ncbi:uncharacterized protein LOC124372026 [Homalodisca vitripennis]|uniref:uncharacterized protein LOC124372026 n=1 Tax=Homalodisca vitripennis TaxID=197043 RepID=UPI001EEB6F30|nr:uncharacterized protein LOC124372026 [Homalodisca vitripennis]XP_046686357.1 uncharacterized protein LOC124372026 [Homalodisca vitripennis]
MRLRPMIKRDQFSTAHQFVLNRLSSSENGLRASPGRYKLATSRPQAQRPLAVISYHGAHSACHGIQRIPVPRFSGRRICRYARGRQVVQLHTGTVGSRDEGATSPGVTSGWRD